jgi:hypothetical protein
MPVPFVPLGAVQEWSQQLKPHRLLCSRVFNQCRRAHFSCARKGSENFLSQSFERTEGSTVRYTIVRSFRVALRLLP